MIDVTTFAKGMMTLSLIFGKELSTEAIQAWHSLLSSELNDSQFNKAVEICLKTCDFFPSPRQVIESVKGSLEDLVCDDLTLLQDKREQELSDAGKYALSMIGGIYEYKHGNKPDLFRREFEKFHRAWWKSDRRGCVKVLKSTLRTPEEDESIQKSIEAMREKAIAADNLRRQQALEMRGAS